MDKNIYQATIVLLLFVNTLSAFETAPKYFYQLKFIMLVITILLVIFKCFKNNINQVGKSNLYSLYIIIIYLVANIYGLYIGNALISNLLLWLSYLLLAIYCFILNPLIINNIVEYKKLYINMFFSISVAIIFGIILALFRVTKMGYFDYQRNTYRFLFSFSNANSLGLFAGISNIIAFKVYKLNKRKMYGISIILFFIITYLSGSRSSIYLLIIFYTLYILITIYNKVKYKFIFISILLFIILILVTVSIVNNVNSRMLDSEKLNLILSNRLSNWKLIVQSMNNMSIILGRGISVSASALGLGEITYENSFLKFYTQSGLIGLSLVIILILYIIYKLIKMKESGEGVYSLSLIFAWVIYCNFENALFSAGNSGSIFVWLDVALSLSKNSIGISNEKYCQLVKHRN